MPNADRKIRQTKVDAVRGKANLRMRGVQDVPRSGVKPAVSDAGKGSRSSTPRTSGKKTIGERLCSFSPTEIWTECSGNPTLRLGPDRPEREMVKHPAHYGGDTPHEVIKCLEAWGLEKDAYLWNAVKYIARSGKKGKALEDLLKAQFYLNRRIAVLQSANAGKPQSEPSTAERSANAK